MMRSLLFLLCWLGSPAAFASDADTRFLRGLVDRGLFESVELFCEQKFNDNDLAGPTKFLVAAELVRSHTQKMILAEPSQRENIRNDISQLENFLNRFAPPTPTDKELLARNTFLFQQAISDFLLGDWLRLEAEAAPATEREEKMRQARSVLYDSLEKFKRCDEETKTFRPEKGRDAGNRRIQSLLWSIRSQWSLAQVSLALTFPSGEDRSYSLRQAVEMLLELAGLGIDDPVVYRSRIELARCYRLLGETDHCLQQLGILNELHNAGKLSDDLLHQAQAEMLRCYLAVDEIEGALRDYAGDRETLEHTMCPDYMLARLELLLADRDQDNTSQILETIKSMERRFGAYWGRRARMVLSASPLPGSQGGHGNAELLKTLADDQFQDGRFAEAVRLYDLAGLAAETAGDRAQSFRNASAALGVLHATLEKASDNETDAARARKQLIVAIRALTKRFPDQPDSSEYHLKAVDLTAESVQKKQNALSDYIEILQEHAVRWPDSAKVPPALLRAALLCERQGDVEDALALLQRIPNHSAAGLDAVQAARRCFAALGKTATNSETDHVRKEAIWFQKRLPGERTETWNEADAAAALHAAECFNRIFHRAAQTPESLEYLKTAEKLLLDTERCAVLTPKMAAQTQALLVRVLQALGKRDDAAKRLEGFDASRLETLSATEKRAFQRVHAQLLADLGKTQEAIDLLASLLKQNQDDLSLWEILAEILSQQQDEKSLTRALQYWTLIADRAEQRAAQESELWWTARQRILEIHLRLGQQDRAKKGFELLRLLYPDLGGPARKAALEALFEGMFEASP